MSNLLWGASIHCVQSLAICGALLACLLHFRHDPTRVPGWWADLFWGAVPPWLLLGLVLDRARWSAGLSLLVVALDGVLWTCAALAGGYPALQHYFILFLYISLSAAISVAGIALGERCGAARLAQRPASLWRWSPALQLCVHLQTRGVMHLLLVGPGPSPALLHSVGLVSEVWNQGWFHLLLAAYFAGEVHQVRSAPGPPAGSGWKTRCEFANLSYSRLLIRLVWVVARGLRVPSARQGGAAGVRGPARGELPPPA